MSRDHSKFLARAKLAVEQAGFIDVAVEHTPFDYGNGLRLRISGACPCGLGRSGMGMALYGEDLATPHRAATALSLIRRGFKDHIEEDRKAGRWV